MTRPARGETQRPEPATQGYANLIAWLRGPPRRSQALLAIACHVSQPTLSQYLGRWARPDADSEVALLLELATGGKVKALDWLTAEERVERRRRRADAANFARAIASGKRVVITMKVARSPRFARNDGESLAAGEPGSPAGGR